MLKRLSAGVTPIIVMNVLAAAVLGCGPTITKEVRYTWSIYDEKEMKQPKSGIVLENLVHTEPPPILYVDVQSCGANQGAALGAVDDKGNPIVERVSFVQPGQIWFHIAITNNTDHIIRTNGTVMRLFDPANYDVEPLTKDEVFGEFIGMCMPRRAVASRFRVLKFLDRHVEILPKTTYEGFIAFRPASLEIPGIWKLAIYEVPVETDQAGVVSRTERFELHQVRKKFEDTYKQKTALSKPELVSSREVVEGPAVK